MHKARVWMMAALASVAGCGGGDGDDGGTGPSVFTTLSVAPATVSVVVTGTQSLTVTAKDQAGATMTGLTTTYTSGSPSIATVTAAGVVTGVAVGTTTINVSGTVGTVTKPATVNVAVAARPTPGPTAAVNATLLSTFEPGTVFITPNGVVTWTFAMEHNVTFSGTAPTGGNIPNTASGSVQRTFPAAGTFNYSCTIHPGMNGSVVVQ